MRNLILVFRLPITLVYLQPKGSSSKVHTHFRSYSTNANPNETFHVQLSCSFLNARKKVLSMVTLDLEA